MLEAESGKRSAKAGFTLFNLSVISLECETRSFRLLQSASTSIVKFLANATASLDSIRFVKLVNK